MTRTPQNSPDIENWLKLTAADGVGPVIFGRLLNYFGSPEKALGASVSELTKVEALVLIRQSISRQAGTRPTPPPKSSLPKS